MIQTQDGTEMTGSTVAQVVEMPPLLRLELENAHLRTMLLELQLQEAQRTRQKKAQEIAAELKIDLSAYELDINRGIAIRVVPTNSDSSTSTGSL